MSTIVASGLLVALTGCAGTADQASEAEGHGGTSEATASASSALLEGHRIVSMFNARTGLGNRDKLTDTNGNGRAEIFTKTSDGKILALELSSGGGLLVAGKMEPGISYGGWNFWYDHQVSPIGNMDGLKGTDIFIESWWGMGILKTAGYGSYSATWAAPWGTQFAGITADIYGRRLRTTIRGDFANNGRSGLVAANESRFAMLTWNNGALSPYATFDLAAHPSEFGQYSGIHGAGKYWGSGQPAGLLVTGNNYLLLQANGSGGMDIKARMNARDVDPDGVMIQESLPHGADFLKSGKDSMLFYGLDPDANSLRYGMAVVEPTSDGLMAIAAKMSAGTPMGLTTAQPATFHIGHEPAAVDVDGDGQSEVAIRSTNGDVLVVRANRELGTFGLVAWYPVNYRFPGTDWVLSFNDRIVCGAAFDGSGRESILIERDRVGFVVVGMDSIRNLYGQAYYMYDSAQ